LHKLVILAKKAKSRSSFGDRLSFYLLQTLRGTGPLIQENQDLVYLLKMSRPLAFMRWRLLLLFFFYVYVEPAGSCFP
jgi:hypothetical protein